MNNKRLKIQNQIREQTRIQIGDDLARELFEAIFANRPFEELVRLINNPNINIGYIDPRRVSFTSNLTLLLAAVMNKRLDVVKELLSTHGNATRPELKSGPPLLRITALMMASLWSLDDIAIELLKPGINSCVDCVDSEGRTALIYASLRNNEKSVAIVKELLKRNVDVGHKDNEGGTALMYAAGTGSYDIAKLLLNTNKSCPECKNNNGETAADIALKHDYMNVYNMIQFRKELNDELYVLKLFIYNNRKNYNEKKKTNTTTTDTSVFLWPDEFINHYAQTYIDKLRKKYDIQERYSIKTYATEDPNLIDFNIIRV